MSYSDLVLSLLHKRGITGEQEIETFLHPDYVRDTHDPFLMPDMRRAVERIMHAMERNEHIAIYADFDCDGIPGAAILSEFFAKIGYMNVSSYIPHRDREGYGFHISAIDALKERGTTLIITVDVGTAAIETVAYAQSIGIDCVVTDHHEIMNEMPHAYALVNPKHTEGDLKYPFTELCGAGVAYKLVCALLMHGKSIGDPRFVSIIDGWEKWLLDLVAIATIADMVPLVGENRTLVYWGLYVLRRTHRVGLVALCAQLALRREEITEDDIGFSIAPRINAASRMGDPELAFELLTTHDCDRAAQIAKQLEELNASRKGTVSAMVKELRKRVKARFTSDDRVIVVGDTSWKPALAGLAAQSIMGDRGGVVCVWGKDANGKLKGSCRSDGTYALPELFRAGEKLFESFGGHDASGGFVVSHEHVHTLADDLARVAATLIPRSDDARECNEHDYAITTREVTLDTMREMRMLAPFGVGNPKPIIRLSRMTIVSSRSFGKEKNHVEVAIADEGGASLRCFDFFRTTNDFSHSLSNTIPATIYATLERDTYRGGVSLRLIDIVAE